jgi:hypothetical protein
MLVDSESVRRCDGQAGTIGDTARSPHIAG